MTENNFSNILTFEDRFPIKESLKETSFSKDEIHDLNHSAKEVLSALIALEQIGSEPINTDASSHSAELHKLEQKIDFVTELLVKILIDQQNRPATKTLKMSAKHLCWRPDISLSMNDYCTLSVHLSSKYPTALELPVVVTNSNRSDASNLEVEAQILLTDENVMDDLTRMVFLYHRKQIARNRTQG